MNESNERAIRLDQWLKLHGLAATGGQAKILIQSGAVHVNGECEMRRRRQLHPGDVVAVDNESFTVQ